MANKAGTTLLLITLILFSSTSSASDREKVYKIGVVPQFETKKLHKIWQPILQQLEDLTGLKFKLQGAATIPSFEKELLNGQFDFAYVNPFHLLIANESQGYLPIVRDHSKKLQGILVTRKDGNIQKLKDLNHKTLAFPSPNALGASLQMRAELTDKFNLNFTPKYVNTHDSVYLNVLLNQAVAGGGVRKTFNKQPKQIRQALKIIYKTTPVAPHPVVVHPTVKKEISDKVRKAFIKLAKSIKGKTLLAKIPIRNPGNAFLEDYQSLNKMNLKRFYKSK